MPVGTSDLPPPQPPLTPKRRAEPELLAAAMATNLEDVPSLDLMHELLRRMKCSSKPDKRLILIGMSARLSSSSSSSSALLAGRSLSRLPRLA